MTTSTPTNGNSNGASNFNDLDVVIVGGGFGGTNCLWNLRKLGFNVHLIEKSNKFGGVWTWNHYPGTIFGCTNGGGSQKIDETLFTGARVDSDVPTFELSHPDLWNDWKWSERFPGQPEILKYFEYVNGKLDLEKDTS